MGQQVVQGHGVASSTRPCSNKKYRAKAGVDEGGGERRRVGVKCGRGKARGAGKWQCGKSKPTIEAASCRSGVVKGNYGSLKETPSQVNKMREWMIEGGRRHVESPSDGRWGSWIKKQKGKTVRRGAIFMQSDKARHVVEGCGSGVEDVELQLGFIGKNWYVLLAPILDFLKNMILLEEYWLMEMVIPNEAKVETFWC